MSIRSKFPHIPSQSQLKQKVSKTSRQPLEVILPLPHHALFSLIPDPARLSF